MHLGDAQNRLALLPAPPQQRQQIEGNIRVAAQAQVARALRIASNQLGDDVDALAVQVARYLAVIEADVVLLRQRIAQLATGLQVELLDAHIGRQLAAAQIAQVIQLDIVAIHAAQERPHETLFQLTASLRFTQRQGGIDEQRTFRQGFDPLIKRVDEAIGLAQPQRQTQADGTFNTGQYRIHGLFQ